MLEQFDDTTGNQGIIGNHLCCDVCAQIVSVGRGDAQMVREAWVFCCRRPQSLTRKLFQQEMYHSLKGKS